MRFLVDTHAFLWFANGDARLSRFAESIIADSRHDVFVSIASVWEIAVKVRIGKLNLDLPLHQLLERELPEYELLTVSVDHVLQTATLPLHHRDPFDRMLASQALVENLPLISIDPAFDHYGVDRLWQSPSDA